MKLQILIPQYHETEEVIYPLLSSIALQQNVDFSTDIGVIICSDGGEVLLSKEFLSSFPYHIQYYSIPHSGVSAARQVCLDRATADYVMFCDADDMFLSVCGIWLIFHEIDNGGFDTFESVFAEETRIFTGKPDYIYRQMDYTFIHGKAFRRKFLVDNDIRWNPSLTVHEDSYFCAIAMNSVTDPSRKKECSTPFYLWRWRDDSVSRTNPQLYIMSTYPALLDSDTALVNELNRRNLPDKARYYCVYQIFDTFYSLNMDYWWESRNKKYKDATEIRFKKYYNEFKDLFYSMSQTERNNLSIEIRTKKMDEGMGMEIMTFNDWITHILSI